MLLAPRRGRQRPTAAQAHLALLLVALVAALLGGCQRDWRDRGSQLGLQPYGPQPYGPQPNDWGAPHSPGERAAAFAQSMLGRPYCWGGKGPSCFDCSGLTYSSWRSVGVSIPRTSGAQHSKLPAVSMARLQPGDILWRPGHVGIYIGNGWAIHAPQRGKPVQYQAAHKYRAAHRPAPRR